jgi:hypothetical protein
MTCACTCMCVINSVKIHVCAVRKAQTMTYTLYIYIYIVSEKSTSLYTYMYIYAVRKAQAYIYIYICSKKSTSLYIYIYIYIYMYIYAVRKAQAVGASKSVGGPKRLFALSAPLAGDTPCLLATHAVTTLNMNVTIDSVLCDSFQHEKTKCVHTFIPVRIKRQSVSIHLYLSHKSCTSLCWMLYDGLCPTSAFSHNMNLA